MPPAQLLPATHATQVRTETLYPALHMKVQSVSFVPPEVQSEWPTAVHARQVDALATLYKPAVQLLQEPAPSPLYIPAWHCKHTVAPNAEYKPAVHAVHWMLPAPLD